MKEFYLRRSLQGLLIAAVMVMMMSLPAFADCNHNWVLDDTSAYDYSDTQHRIVKTYYCSECWESKEEESYANHTWNPSITKYGYTNLSEAAHSYKMDYYCTECFHEHTVTVTENHNFDAYHHCQSCDATVANNTTLKAGKTSYINNESWIKIKVSKKGYIKVNITPRNKSNHPYWSLYKSNKSPYLDATSLGNKMCVPVKKGTYYLRADEDATVKYTFTADPSKKNYTKKKAITLKKNAKALTLLYPSDKKNTWTRYYKIKLTKKQYLHITCSNRYNTPNAKDYGYFGWTVTDSKGEPILFDSEYNSSGMIKGAVSFDKLKKGTYYIKVYDKWSGTNKKKNIGHIIALKWK